MDIAIKVKDPKDRLDSYIFQNHKDTIGKISDYTEEQINQVRAFFISIKGRSINDISVFNNRLLSSQEEIVRCKIKASSNYDFSLVPQNTNVLFSKVIDFDIKKKDKLVFFLQSIVEKTLSFRKRKNKQSQYNQYKQKGLSTLNTRDNCIIFSSKPTIDKLTKALQKYKDLYAPNDNLVYGNYIEKVKTKSYGFINNWVGIIIIILGMAFIIYKLLEYLK